jgi:RHS repeat-associated protein
MFHKSLIVRRSSLKGTVNTRLPLGMCHTGVYRFSFNGKEKLDEINGAGNDLDFGARIYDTRLGRWFSIDPAAIQYPMHSNYSFAACNPIRYYDKDGKFLGTLIGAAIGGITAAARGESVKAGIISGAVAGAVWDLAIGAIVVSGGTATPVVLTAAGVMSGMAGDLVYQGMTKGWAKIDGNQNVMSGAIGGATGGLLGSVAPKLARWLSGGKAQVLIEPLQLSPIKYGGKYSWSTEVKGYSNVEKHFEKRLQDGYNFKDADEMIRYGEDFFKRQGENIQEFISKEGYLHRIDTKTQEYGVISSEGIVETVMKVTPKPNSNYKNAEEYLKVQLDKHGANE